MTHDTPIRVDHVGIAVPDVESAEPFLEALGCRKLVDEVVLSDTSVPVEEAGDEGRFRWAYYELGDASRLELVAPVAEDTFLTDFLDRNGPGLHHVTFDVADADAVAAAVEAAGGEVIDRAEYDDWTEAFVSPRNPTGALFQFIEHHDSYPDGRRPPETLYVRGTPVEEVAPPAAEDPDDGRDAAGAVAAPDFDADDGVAEETVERVLDDPFCRSLGIELTALAPGGAEARLTVTEDLLNFHGTPHGGAVYSLADAAFAAASNARGETALALETNCSYLDAVDVGDTLSATAAEVHRSRRTASYEVPVTDGDGDRVATFRGRVYLP